MSENSFVLRPRFAPASPTRLQTTQVINEPAQVAAVVPLANSFAVPERMPTAIPAPALNIAPQKKHFTDFMRGMRNKITF